MLVSRRSARMSSFTVAPSSLVVTSRSPGTSVVCSAPNRRVVLSSSLSASSSLASRARVGAAGLRVAGLPDASKSWKLASMSPKSKMAGASRSGSARKSQPPAPSQILGV